MGRTREGWYERGEERGRITADWVKVNCANLTEREKEIVELVDARKLVRRDHLEVISPSYRKVGKSRTILLNRAIKKLFKLMVLDKIHEKQGVGKGNSPAIVSVDRAGSILLGKPHKRRIIQRDVVHKGKVYVSRSLPANYRHINGVNQLEVETILIAEEHGYEILEWLLEEAKTFHFNNEKATLIPDVLLIIKIEEELIGIFIEYDTGSEGLREKEPKVITEKLKKYRRYSRTQLLLEEKWQKYFKQPTFPFLLFVTEDAKRIKFFNEEAKKMGLRALGVYHEKFKVVLPKLLEALREERE